MIRSRKLFSKLAALAVLLDVLPSAQAKEQPAQQAAIFGYGVSRCGDFIAASGGVQVGKERFIQTSDGTHLWGEHALFLNWGTGFISGKNFSNPDHQVEDMSVPSFDLWLRNYCTAHPTSAFINAVAEFYESEKKK